MLIELAGPCGSGKTTLLMAAAEAAGTKSVSLQGRRSVAGRRQAKLERWAAWVWVAATSPVSTLRVLHQVETRGPALRRALEAMHKARWLRRLRRQGESAVIDEGPLHMMSLALAMSQARDEKLLQKVSCADVVVYPDTPIEVTVDRAMAEGGRTFFEDCRQGPREAAEAYRSLLLTLRDAPGNRASFVVSDDPDELLASVREVAERLDP